MSTILIINDSYLPPKKAAEIPKNEPIIRAKIPDNTMNITAKNAGDNDFISFDLSLFMKLNRSIIKI